MAEILYQLWLGLCIVFIAVVVVPIMVYIVMKVGTFAVLMGRKRFLEYQIRKEEERQHGKS